MTTVIHTYYAHPSPREDLIDTAVKAKIMPDRLLVKLFTAIADAALLLSASAM